MGRQYFRPARVTVRYRPGQSKTGHKTRKGQRPYAAFGGPFGSYWDNQDITVPWWRGGAKAFTPPSAAPPRHVTQGDVTVGDMAAGPAPVKGRARKSAGDRLIYRQSDRISVLVTFRRTRRLPSTPGPRCAACQSPSVRWPRYRDLLISSMVWSWPQLEQRNPAPLTGHLPG